ncbi:MAG: ankyrin repeat domain-containing protein [Caldilineaceae bacterium SB0662_bin_25]|nr:ankyrin repeat domain-containing protein [Caldilineaceae bacterium SB0662_bin_25]
MLDAIEEENEELVRMLVEAGADVDMPGWLDETPLHAAIERGNVEIAGSP